MTKAKLKAIMFFVEDSAFELCEITLLITWMLEKKKYK